MYLKALKLHGFKSFADPTTLIFEPGVTAVVGPNGCGKSNIADAIRWVLGEQSAKALRGGKMQDVIFEGTETRQPAQLSEVSLLLTDCEQQLGSQYHEIEIMRRGYRDGMGEYYFNGQPCRLKDIHRLFMDTGVGRTSYSIMAQGQIDQILSNKPDERRAVFEEAAGITKYKSQRREAMNKLAMTDQNLARVADVMAEVTRQIGSLRRQAAKAMRYKRLSHRLRHLSLAWSCRQHASLRRSSEAAEAAASALRTAAASRREKLESSGTGLEHLKERRSHLNQRAQDAQQAVYDLRSQRDAAENASRLAQARRESLEERLEAAKEGLTEIEMQRREVAAQEDTGTQDKQMQLNLLGRSDAVFQERNRDLALADGALGKLEQELQQAKFQLLQCESVVARLRTESSGYEVEQKTSAHRHEALDRELTEARQRRDEVARTAAGLAERVTAAQAERDRVQGEVAAAQQHLADATRDFREAQRGLQEVDRQLAQRGARLKLLQQLQERWEGFGEGARALLQGRLEQALAGSQAVPISRGLEIRKEFGAAIAALFGSAAEAVSVTDAATASRILDQLEREQIGSVILRLADRAMASGEAGELPPGLIRAANALSSADGEHPALALLASCYIADDLGGFLDYWRDHPEFSFLAVATRKGEVVDRRGLVSGGHSSRKPAGGIVQREIDLRETAAALADDQKSHDERKARVDELSARLAAAEPALEQRRAELMGATQTAAAAQAEQRDARRLADEADARLARDERELATLAEARAEAELRWAKAQSALGQAAAAVGAQQEAVRRTESRLTEARAERDSRREALSQARLELAERRQKVEVLDRGLGEMARRREQLDELFEQRQREIETWSEQVGALDAETAAELSRAQKIAETAAVAQAQVEEVRRDLVAVEGEIDAAEAEQARLRAEADSAQGELSAQEIKLAEFRQRLAFLVEEIAREFQVDIAALEWKSLLWRAGDEPEGLQTLDLDDEEPAAATDDAAPPAEAKSRGRRPKKPRDEPTEADLAALDATDWDAVKAEVDGLRQRLAAMGAVNLVAIEEYAELKQRHDFLQAQTGDLGQAKTELVKMIDEINCTSQEQFAVTFEQIRKNFAYTFQTLFGGGRAELELVQAEDVLESGVEIIAQPPGTRLKGISLLSGGQRALTAVALLFALYLVKPSPFCLLDELDAPLDESNIGRFTELLKKFIKDSQFIIITHNKRTVAAADAIYGVTMPDRGVSKTVSMRFNHERGEAEARPVTLAEAVSGTALASAPA
jgi:chromosome segregation protein